MGFGDWGGGDRGCLVMNMDINFLGLGLSWMWMIVLSLTIERVWGATDARGCGIRGFLGETPVLGLFTIGSVPNTVLKIWLTSSLRPQRFSPSY